MARSGELHPRTYVSCPDRQSPLVYASCTQRQAPHTDTVTGRQRLQLPCSRADDAHVCIQTRKRPTRSPTPRVHTCTKQTHTVHYVEACKPGTYTQTQTCKHTHNSCFLPLAGTTTEASPDPGILWPTCSRHTLLTGLCHRRDVYSSVLGSIYRIIARSSHYLPNFHKKIVYDQLKTFVFTPTSL